MGRYSAFGATMMKLQLDSEGEQVKRLVKIVRRFKGAYDYCIIDTHNQKNF